MSKIWNISPMVCLLPNILRTDGETMMLIVSVSAPRAGSSWYYQMITVLLLAAGQQNAESLREKYRWLFPGATRNMNVGILYGTKLLRLAALSQAFGSFAVKTHAKPTRMLRVLSRYRLAKSIFIYRDPRDRLVSIMNIAAKQREAGIGERSFAYIQGFDDALEAVTTSYQHFKMWEQNPETLLVRFEDLVQNRNTEMKRTADFLNLSLSDEAIATALARFDEPNKEKRLHFVSGKIGTYKEALTPEQIQQANTVLADDIVKLGYTLE
jgi:hypothetical protein